MVMLETLAKIETERLQAKKEADSTRKWEMCRELLTHIFHAVLNVYLKTLGSIH